MKDQVGVKIMKEFIGLRTKIFNSYLTDNKDKDRSKEHNVFTEEINKFK